MRASRLASRLKRNHARYRGRNDLNIVPMLDVMVILTFFLIFTAVFSKTSILEVQLPGPNATAALQPPAFALEVIVRKDRLEVSDRARGVLMTLPALAGGDSDLAALTEFLARLKAQHPDQRSVTLLVADDVAYDTIVQVMDAVRVRQTAAGGRVTHEELFPQIALGDAPT